tara:strand:- start:177 stop:737 length:561 start_codon:yes stop_codon:yes gene_type:complete
MKKKEKIIQDSLMHILLDKKLKYIEIDEIIKKAKISTKEFNIYYQNKEQIIISFFSRIDSIMKKKIKKLNLRKNIKDNLFEICMTRFEVLEPYKKSMSNIYLSLINQPNLAINFYESFFNTMKLILNLSLIDIKHIEGNKKLIIFSLFYLSILNEWINDFSPDNEKTMAVLDKRLSFIESFIIKAN